MSTEISRRGALAAAGTLGAAGFLSSITRAEGAPSQTSERHGYMTHNITFTSHGVKIVGTLFTPEHQHGPVPGIVLLGPFGFVKEQAPVQYATRLADRGYATLIFDPRNSGESGGTPRRHEDPAAKIADAHAALDFLATRAEVDPKRIATIGICQGASEIVAVTGADQRVRATALISGQYLYAENLKGFFGGGGPTLEERIARGRVAKEAYEKSGEVQYRPVVATDDKTVGLPWKQIHDWYQPWTTEKWGTPSRWENRYTAMSDAEVWTFNVDDYTPKVAVPTLIVHGDQSDGGPQSAQHVFDRLTVKDKRIVIVPQTFHTRFYDDPLVIEPAVAEIVAWFGAHLHA